MCSHHPTLLIPPKVGGALGLGSSLRPPKGNISRATLASRMACHVKGANSPVCLGTHALLRLRSGLRLGSVVTPPYRGADTLEWVLVTSPTGVCNFHPCSYTHLSTCMAGVPVSREWVHRCDRRNDVWLTTGQTPATFSASNRLHRTTFCRGVG